MTDLTKTWALISDDLKTSFPQPVFQTFISPARLTSLENNTATISFPNTYLAEINQRRYFTQYQTAFDKILNSSTTLNFTCQPAKPVKDPVSTPLFSPSNPITTLNSNLHPKYIFANFVVGNSNNFAYAAAQGIVENPGLSYNPFFIWGGVGVGKTHLMQAIGHALLEKNPSLKIRYFPAETFGNDLIQALKTKTIADFKNKYRQLDCILVDDVQFIANKEYIQEEFFHTFNALHMSGKQVILTSDRKPNDIPDLEDRLVSRFMGGLNVDIQAPDLEMRIAIIHQKAEEKGISISNSAVNFLAENIVSNIRDIEGKLGAISVQARADRVGEIDLAYVTSHSEAPALKKTLTKISPRHLISVCAKHFDIKTSDLCGSGRQKDLVLARHLTVYLLLTELSLPLEQVGRLLNGRDHTSIMHARDKIKTQLSTNSPLQSHISQILAAL